MARASSALLFLLAPAAALSCGDTVREVPPLGEVLVIVDTDMPVPKLVARLRVDVYAEDGTWYASRDVPRSRASDWPTSFGVYAPDQRTERVATVRLRAYAEGKVRDYRGERFAPRPVSGRPLEVTAPPPATGAPRLLDEGGADVTPANEPEPLLTIDRLLRVRVKPGVRGAVRVVLRGACVGTMADLAGARTCVDTEDVRVALAEAALDADTSLPARSLAGSFETPAPCTVAPRAATFARDGTPLHDDEACAPGATFVLGSRDGMFTEIDDLPQRIAIVAPFLIDRYEVTVARWRKALADGFKSPDTSPYTNEGPLATSPVDFTDPSLCVWSAAPRGRETYAVSCITFQAARAFCRWAGGDLPSEAQWEYAATVAGRALRSRFPWGGDDAVQPTCDRAIWGRGEIPLVTQQCVDGTGRGFGPQPADARAGDGGDVTPGLGLVNMAGGVAEWTRDAFVPMTANCWAASGLHEPGCDVASVDRVARGGAWREGPVSLISAAREHAEGANSEVGFRCVRRGAP